ncbi:MAG TPA: hypothetical protein VF681_04415 [Abditibacteriaceae bacterium]|jgi:hypothetical protein
MKISFFLLAALAIPAAAQTATEQTPPLTETVERYAAVDPKALKLLSRVADKYQRAISYSGVVSLRFGQRKQLKTTRFRVALNSNRGSISKAETNNVEHWESDGRQTLATAKNKPKQYVLKPLNVDGFWRIQREEFWKRAGFEGALPELLSGKFGTLLLSPDLKRISVEPSSQAGATQKIIIELNSPHENVVGTMSLYIANDFTLQRAAVHETGPQEVLVWDERHSEIVMQAAAATNFHIDYSLVPPKGFRRVESFDEPTQATAPVNYEAQKKTETNKLKPRK